jgi:hypothetical protein
MDCSKQDERIRLAPFKSPLLGHPAPQDMHISLIKLHISLIKLHISLIKLSRSRVRTGMLMYIGKNSIL